MIRFGIGLIFLLALCLPPVSGQAQVDNVGAIDTVFADVAKVDDNLWTITVSYFNDERVLGLTIPLRMTSGLNRIVADSAVFADGRIEHFNWKIFRADTAIQCVLIGGVGPGAVRKVLEPGSGRVATIYVSSLDKKPIEKLDIDTTTVHPNNSLMSVADRLQSDTDTMPLSPVDVQIIPAFVVRKAK